MSIDTQRVGELAAEFMQQVEDVYGEDAEIDEAIIIATVAVPDEEDGGKRQNTSIRCSSPNPVVQAGLLVWGKRAVLEPDERDD